MASLGRFLLLLVAGLALIGLGYLVPMRLLAQASTPTLAILAPTSPILPTAGTLDVQVVISDTTDLGAFELDLTYDHTLITITGITANPALGQVGSCDPNTARCAVTLGPLDISDGTSLGAYTLGTGPGMTGSGVVAVIQLQLTGLEGTTPLHINSALLSDVEGNPTSPLTQDALLVIASPAPPNLVFLPVVRR